MKSTILVLAASGLLVTGLANASEELAKKNGCTTACHAIDQKKVGPSFKDVAARNKGKAGAEGALVAKVKGGKQHPPVKASDADLKAIVKWVLAM